MFKTNDDAIQFVSNQKNQQKLIYRGRCFTLKRTNCRLILNARNNYNLIYEGRVYQLKHTNFEDKQWVCQGVKRRFRSVMHTNSNVNAVLKFAPHAHNCTPYSNILHKIEKYLYRQHICKFGNYQSVFNIQKKARQKDFPCCQQLKIPAVSQKATSKKFEFYLSILSGGVLIPGLKLLLNGTSRCSPFMRHSYMLSVLQPLKR
ncbi:hypothetical protein T01_10791 [Trichinella spiralis]|uniref:FLYWCH-type domain-containing protein n=1 Tax=Trichinella spiralis TaxID=6334 RepID=A0A0V1BEQ9_TRISP|nr:hypothetical protein T01_10791 [Trichinella spiralis]